MGGKTKQTQRTKNNAKPSNSGRSAELLGTSVPSFVGFSAHSDLGMVPFAPGFSTVDNLPETFDSSICTQFQLVLRKMSKKDPITKAKALQEFIDLLTESDVDVVKGILPLWPKFYHNLANDVDHRVRESTQNVQNLIVSKCKKAVAPYLKQLTPVWLGSQFDNYPPAASVAASSFQSVFAANKMQEVCLFCQQDILEYIVRNLTFHTAATLSSAKSCTPEEAEHKYQRVVVCSLKMLSFFLEKTAGSDISLSTDKIHALLSHQKFWSFAKHKATHIKSAWFELLYNVLQYTPVLTKEIKGQLIPMCFQNIDDSDPFIVPNVWGCILLLQNTYDDWYKSINFKKNVQTKLCTFLHNGCNGNAATVCPNLLPFLSKLTQESLQDVSLEQFYKDFFNALTEPIITPKTVSKSDISSLTAAFYECIRFIIQRFNTAMLPYIETSQLPQNILDEFINHPIRWSCRSSGIATKYIFRHTSALIAYWAAQSNSKLCSQLLNGFWSALTNDIEKEPLNDTIVDNTTELITFLYWANPNLEMQKVKFSTGDETDGAHRQKSKPMPLYVQVELRKFAVLFVRLCLACVSNNKSLLYESQIRRVTKLYGDAEFYAEISGENDIEITLNLLADILRYSFSEPSEIVVEIVFEMLNYTEKDRKLQFINRLLETKKPTLQQCILQRLLSYPMCVEPEVRVMLSQDHVIEIILQTACEVLVDDSKDKFNLLHKCFFQTDSGEILINQTTVDGILNIISQPLTNPDGFDAMMEPCCRFISQIMPVVCSNNSTEQAQKNTFLKLFQFTIVQKESDDLSQDTLWEIASCWQDALSSKDIIMDDDLLHKCAEIISKSLSATADINKTADIMSKLILCSTENIADETKRYEVIDSYVDILFKPANENFNRSYEAASKLCTFLEVLQDKVTVIELPEDAGVDIELEAFFKRSFLNLDTITKMVANLKDGADLVNASDFEDFAGDYVNESLLTRWTEKLYDFTVELIKVAAMANSLASNWITAPKDGQYLMLEISEMAKRLLKNMREDNALQIKYRLIKDASFNDLAATRAVPFLVAILMYSQFEENALILLQEDLTEFFIEREATNAYVNLWQFVTPNIGAKVITSDDPILSRKDAEFWQKCVVFRCLIYNNFNVESNDIVDKKIIALALNFITDIAEKQKQTDKDTLLYNTDVSKQSFLTLTRVVEYVKLLRTVLQRFPYELTIRHWDAIRIGLSSWVLSISKSVQNYTNSKVAVFANSIFNLYAQLAIFIEDEKAKSSSEVLTNMIDEWENLFSPEVSLVLFKSFYSYVSLNETKDSTYSTSYATLMEEMALCLQRLDFSVIYIACKNGKPMSLNDLVSFLLKNISSPINNLRKVSAIILVKLAQFFIASDRETFEKTTDIVDANVTENSSAASWHYLSKFKIHLTKYEAAILKYLNEFSFKLTELPELKPIDRLNAQSYLLLWDVIMRICAKAPVELRSVYTSWLTENKFDENFLNFLFRTMPVEILKNHDSKLMGNELFNVLNLTEWENKHELSTEKYACYLYSTALSKLPAVVRKWWNGSHSRQKVFVDKLTTNFVSGLICQDELETIARINIKDKHNNMQVTVHTSTREVNAVYFIDEARMELIITLAPNYPLGGVKVESGKQIGGRASSRNTAMQLTIFLTHQNGSIFDGLSLWKKNLDKKFEGVEECYVCYTVIHQDTCQLPKLTCKTCRKKFHSPCLYKWFTTSSKSTCPICRNIF